MSWELSSDFRGDYQTAYQILVASSYENLEHNCGDLWDTGKVFSESSLDHPYSGKPLRSNKRYYCKVRVWDQNGHASPWSWGGGWETGMLSNSDWHAKWIGSVNPGAALPIFRKSFVISKAIRLAILHISGLGQYHAFIDGRGVSNELLQPGWTLYSKTILYDGYDLSYLKPGQHVIEVMLGNGMYNQPATPGRYEKFVHSYGPPKLIAQLDIEYANGLHDCVATNSSWDVAAGPITFSSIYGGEDYDGRLRQLNWTSAKETVGPGGTLRGSNRSAAPIRVCKTFQARKVTAHGDRITVCDMGQNCAMVPAIAVKGPAGSRVRIWPGELLDKNGLVTQASMGGPVYFTYTLRGDGIENWRPLFTYVGCRYFQIEKLPNDRGELPQIMNVQGDFVSSSSLPTGEFACSNELFNRTNQLIRWAMRSNMMSILTDCPHRERLGWLEESYLNGPGLMDNFSLPVMFEKIAGDMADSQLANGLMPDIAPEYTQFSGPFRDSPEWGSACVQVPWQAYEWYGDAKILRDHYGMMQRYVAYLGTKAQNHILSYGLGDWFDLGPNELGESQLTPKGLTATAIYYDDVQKLVRIAGVLGDTTYAKEMKALSGQIRAAFNAQFYHPRTHEYGSGSQTSNAMPYVFGMEPPADVAAVLDNIVGDVRQRRNALTAGDVGYRYVLEALASSGRSDVIFDMNNQTTRPGYGYQIAHGATSLTEAWDAHAFSQDHFMLGHIMQWFYGDLAGIRQMPGSVGFEHIQIKPNPVGDITWARASYHSVRGMITSSWRKSSGKFSLEIRIPPGADATVYIPGASESSVYESGHPADQSPCVRCIGQNGNTAVFIVKSGQYYFQTK